ncbi:MAG TPA: rRNA maturation RNase YbeY [Chthoniobacterales bacterium]
MPVITVRNRQRAIGVKLSELERFAERALAECLRLPARTSDLLVKVPEVSVVLLSDRRMAALHRRFLNEAGPTDVITFEHGEIVISAETAWRQARAFRTSLDEELRLYIVHGLLHLRGYDDRTPKGAAEMKRVQERIVAEVDRALRRAMANSRGGAYK